MAIRVEQSVLIERNIEDVWNWMADTSNLATWQGGVSAVEDVQGEGPGATHVEVRHVMGREMRSRVEITDYQPPYLMGFRVLEGPVLFQGHQTAQEENGGTRVTILIEAEPGGFFAVAAPLLQGQVSKDTEADLQRLKMLLEGG
ncbi:MAG: SRPBCC family protein [Anaerolineae bacterium]|nr:SRPBCC family protein [Anaerolineae bacterium]